jgi:hypothetical protein
MLDEHSDWGRTLDQTPSVGAWHRYKRHSGETINLQRGGSWRTVCGSPMFPEVELGPLPAGVSISTVCPFCLKGRLR